MVKSGMIIEEWGYTGRGKNKKRIRVKAPVSRPVYFPEINGEIDLMRWRLTEKEAILAERWDKIFQETEPEMKALYKRRREAWNQICDELGLQNRKMKEAEG